MFVSHYRVTRHFGGREEGGWYYDRNEFVAVIATCTDKQTAGDVASALSFMARAEKRQPTGIGGEMEGVKLPFYQGRYSVAGGADDYYYAESKVGMHDDTDKPRPHYE